MSPLTITSLYASLLGLLLVVLSARVAQARLAHEVSLGDGGHEDLLVAQRGQGNFIEYVPLALILIGLVELNGSPAWVVHALGGTLVLARIAHPFGLAPAFSLRAPRAVGSIATWIVIAAASVILLAARFA
jgi:uncharacterized membrane protein YecN with MAPEG domain